MNPYSLTHGGLPNGYPLDQFEADIRIARENLGLSTNEYRFLSQLMSLTVPQDYEAGAICAVFYSLCNLAEQTSVSVRTINNYERDLTRWIVVTAAKGGKRNGSRRDGKISWAAGINLQPLVDQANLVRALADKAREDHVRLECLRGEIKDYRSKLIASGKLQVANEIYPRARPSEIKNEKRLTEIRDQFCAALGGKREATVWNKIDDVSAETYCPNTRLKQSLSSCTGDQSKHRRADPQFDFPTLRKIATTKFRQHWEHHEEYSDPLTAFTYAAEEVFLSWQADPKIWREALAQHDRCLIALCVFIIDRNMQPDVKERYFVKKPVGCFVGQLRALKTKGLNVHGLLAQLEKQERFRREA